MNIKKQAKYCLPALAALSISVGLIHSQVPSAAGPPPGVPAPGQFIVQPEAPMAMAARPMPQINNIVAFETATVKQLNDLIRNPVALEQMAKRKKNVVVICDTRLIRGIADTKVIVVVRDTSGMAATTQTLTQLRDALIQQVDQAVVSEYRGQPGIRQLGGAVLGPEITTGRIGRP